MLYANHKKMKMNEKKRSCKLRTVKVSSYYPLIYKHKTHKYTFLDGQGRNCIVIVVCSYRGKSFVLFNCSYRGTSTMSSLSSAFTEVKSFVLFNCSYRSTSTVLLLSSVLVKARAFVLINRSNQGTDAVCCQ